MATTDTSLDLGQLRIPLPAAELPAAAPPAPTTAITGRLVTRASTPRRRRRPRPESRLPRHRPGERFLQGPIPMTWLSAAMRLPGKALHVAVAIWQRAGMKRNATIKLNLSRLDGVTHSAASRGLDALERARLVTV